LKNRTRENITNYIKDNVVVSYNIFGVPILFKDKFRTSIDLEEVISEIERVVPQDYFYGIDTILVGDREEFEQRRINAMLQDGAIYISPEQDNVDDLVDDIVHEVAHNVEKVHGQELYGDSNVEVEFLGKRKRLFSLLKSEYGDKIDRWAHMFLESEYSLEFDEFLYNVIGYPVLTNITMGLFQNPYGVTSLGEYFASGFEEYFLNDRDYLRKISPALFNKIENLTLDRRK
jgi:hypothetical protein